MAKTYYKPSRYKYKITGKKRRKICHKQRSSAKELGINLLILTITLVLALLILEVGFRAVFGPHLRYDYPTDTGWELLPDQEGFSIPNHKFASINSLGFRGTEIDPENEGRRIIMIGDSFTFGVGVQDNETMAAQLQARLSKIKGPHLMKDAEVINLGEPGYGVSQMIAKYRKKGADLEPDTVIMTLIEDDIYRQQSTNDPSFYRKTIARKLLTRSVLATYFKPRIEFLRV
ncbi:SGNH/GDSL hydrolase family protein, partial [Candidatus Woesearchaeota archaeon]|nr:SGNH/GDSL hydrolase family protein [Candidatus Woesearchaeota archaeon]